MVDLSILTPEQRDTIVAALEDGALVRRIGGRLWLCKLTGRETRIDEHGIRRVIAAGHWELTSEDEQVTVAYDYSRCSCGEDDCLHIRSVRYGL